MSKIRRGGFVFVAWKADHPPRHVHVYRDRRFVLKGKAPRRVLELIEALQSEGVL